MIKLIVLLSNLFINYNLSNNLKHKSSANKSIVFCTISPITDGKAKIKIIFLNFYYTKIVNYFLLFNKNKKIVNNNIKIKNLFIKKYFFL